MCTVMPRMASARIQAERRGRGMGMSWLSTLSGKGDPSRDGVGGTLIRRSLGGTDGATVTEDGTMDGVPDRTPLVAKGESLPLRTLRALAQEGGSRVKRRRVPWVAMLVGDEASPVSSSVLRCRTNG